MTMRMAHKQSIFETQDGGRHADMTKVWNRVNSELARGLAPERMSLGVALDIVLLVALESDTPLADLTYASAQIGAALRRMEELALVPGAVPDGEPPAPRRFHMGVAKRQMISMIRAHGAREVLMDWDGTDEEAIAELRADPREVFLPGGPCDNADPVTGRCLGHPRKEGDTK